MYGFRHSATRSTKLIAMSSKSKSPSGLGAGSPPTKDRLSAHSQCANVHLSLPWPAPARSAASHPNPRQVRRGTALLQLRDRPRQLVQLEIFRLRPPLVKHEVALRRLVRRQQRRELL